jgi:signal transduction histidine kinase
MARCELAGSCYLNDVQHRATYAEDAQEALGKVREMLAENIERLREIIFQLRPSTLDYLGLEPAIREYFKHFERDTDVSTSLQVDVPERLPGDMKTKVYRFIQEAVDNVRHRPEVTRVGVRIRERGSTIIATIADNGQSVDPAVLEDSSTVRTGLSDAETRPLTLKERAELAGGNLRVNKRSGGGAMAPVVIPSGRSDE